MVPRDIANNIGVKQSIEPQVVAGVVVGDTVDLFGFDGAALVVISGDIAAGLGGIDAEEADDDGTGQPGAWSNIDAADLDGGAFAAFGDDAVQKRGYLGRKRFLRINTLAATAGPIAAFVVCGSPQTAPVA